MKYIRTKDGRIITFVPKEKYENDKATFDWFAANYCGGGINVLKNADTIEELCDEFVIKYENKDKVSLFDICNNFEATKEEYNNYQNEYKNANIFGAIWTDKGLIYVAKMNDKGELELL